ncbi:hypothetical protein [Azospirillum argentinense]
MASYEGGENRFRHITIIDEGATAPHQPHSVQDFSLTQK